MRDKNETYPGQARLHSGVVCLTHRVLFGHEERFASALQEASKADIRSTNGQCVGGAEIWPQPMSMADIDLQSYVFWHTACISGGILRFPKSKVP